MNKVNMGLDDIIKLEKGSNNDTNYKAKKNKQRFGDKFRNSAQNARNIQSPNNLSQSNNSNARIPRSFGFGNKLVTCPSMCQSGISISNLAATVTDSDIMELFCEFGQIVKAAIHFDAQGCHLGSATVTFVQEAAARNAIHKYNGVSLDRSPMRIQLNQSVGPTSLSDRLNFSNTGGIGQCPSMAHNVHGYRSRNLQSNHRSNACSNLSNEAMTKNLNADNNSKRKRDSSPDQDKLDKELEEYMKKNQTKKYSKPRKTLIELEKKKLKKEKSVKLTLKSEESSFSDNDQIYQKDIDNELDMEIERINSPIINAISNEDAEKIQKKLMNLI